MISELFENQANLNNLGFFDHSKIPVYFSSELKGIVFKDILSEKNDSNGVFDKGIFDILGEYYPQDKKIVIYDAMISKFANYLKNEIDFFKSNSLFELEHKILDFVLIHELSHAWTHYLLGDLFLTMPLDILEPLAQLLTAKFVSKDILSKRLFNFCEQNLPLYSNWKLFVQIKQLSKVNYKLLLEIFCLRIKDKTISSANIYLMVQDIEQDLNSNIDNLLLDINLGVIGFGSD